MNKKKENTKDNIIKRRTKEPCSLKLSLSNYNRFSVSLQFPQTKILKNYKNLEEKEY